MATKQQAASITSFFSPVPKRKAQEECSVSAENNMQDSVVRDMSLFRPETEVTVTTVPDQVKYLIRRGSQLFHPSSCGTVWSLVLDPRCPFMCTASRGENPHQAKLTLQS